MGELKHVKRNDSAVALKSDGNPEGKGRNAFMLDWQQSEPLGVVAKPRQQLLAELFTSMLVLSSTFKFRPVIGAPHYLYFINDTWSLSLIAPQEWSSERRSAFAGTCLLQQDMTWTIAPSKTLAENRPVSDAMGQFFDIFADSLNTDRTLEEILPSYVGSMPYYQRLYASGLSRSMRTSMIAGDQADTSCNIWHTQLTHSYTNLVEHGG